MTCWEFSIPCTRGFAARAGIMPSLNLSLMGLAQFLNHDDKGIDQFLKRIGKFLNLLTLISFHQYYRNEGWLKSGVNSGLKNAALTCSSKMLGSCGWPIPRI